MGNYCKYKSSFLCLPKFLFDSWSGDYVWKFQFELRVTNKQTWKGNKMKLKQMKKETASFASFFPVRCKLLGL